MAISDKKLLGMIQEALEEGDSLPFDVRRDAERAWRLRLPPDAVLLELVRDSDEDLTVERIREES